MNNQTTISALSLLILTSACFRPQLQCSPCGAADSCPNGLMCQKGFCVAAAEDICGSVRSDGGGADQALRVDTAPEVADADLDTGDDGLRLAGKRDSAGDAPDTNDVGEPDAAPDGDSGNSSMCSDKCCVNGMCLTFPPRLKQGLLLWADRSSVGPVGFPLDTWRDRSINSTDIVPLNAGMAPSVQIDPVGPVVRIDEPGMVMAAMNGTALRLGIEDFTILVLARTESAGSPTCLFEKVSNGRSSTGLTMLSNSNGYPILPIGTPYTHALFVVTDDDAFTSFSDGTIASQRSDLTNELHLYGARRVEGNRLQLRIDGVTEGETEILRSANLIDETPFFVGSCASFERPYTTTFDGSIAAVVVVRGPLSDTEVVDLERFLLQTMGSAAPAF